MRSPSSKPGSPAVHPIVAWVISDVALALVGEGSNREADDFVAASEETGDDLRADESAGFGDEDAHAAIRV
ncbi:MAG TPA: hypothetical protein VMU37_05775 [Caulobacteraceae bacterium]|nr:hypothetical protein [Caulobacteraceae bacterium]